MRTCSRSEDFWRRRLGAYADGELPSAEARRVRSHLRTCGRCRQELHLVEQMAILVAALPEYAAPPTLAPAVLERTLGVRKPLSLRIYRLQPVLRLGFLTTIVAGFAAAVQFSGLASILTSSLSAVTRAAVLQGSDLIQMARHVGDKLGIIDVATKVGGVLGKSAVTFLGAPPPDFVLALCMTLIFFILVGARAVALRADRRMNHVHLSI